MSRLHPNVTVRRMVRNYSSRAGARPVLIVVHDTESHNRPGNADLAAIGAWFDNPIAQASAHVCTDADGNSARFVRDQDKAWSCVNYNRLSLNIEQIGSSTDPTLAWEQREPELHETARWLARWHHLWGIPLKRGAVGVAGLMPGVVRHMDLGQAGGGHYDPGTNYPLDELLRHARWYARRLG